MVAVLLPSQSDVATPDANWRRCGRKAVGPLEGRARTVQLERVRAERFITSCAQLCHDTEWLHFGAKNYYFSPFIPLYTNVHASLSERKDYAGRDCG